MFVIIAAGVVANQAGLSMALGAFVAGLLLAETEYRKAIEATIEPFKGLLLGIFFFTVGMDIDVRELLREPLLLAAAVAGLIALKSLLLIGLAKLFRLSWPVAIEMGLLLGPGGEFAFVGIGMAAELQLIDARLASFALAVTSVTMALTPLLSIAGRRFAARLRAAGAAPSELIAQPSAGQQTCHRGRLRPRRQSGVRAVEGARHPLYRGRSGCLDRDARPPQRPRRLLRRRRDPKFLEICGLGNAAGVIITIHDHDLIDDVVAHVRAMRADVLIVSRARDADHARHLYELGATDAVPETVEASLQLSEAALVGLGIPVGPVIATIHEKRDEIRRALQDAAREAGLKRSHAVRSKRLPRLTR